MTTDWQPLQAELAQWRREQRRLPLWWRDDDATEDTPPLHQLLGLSEELSLPVHIAVIPEPAQPCLARALTGAPQAVPMVHGWTHRNRAPDGQKKAEFGHPRTDALQEAAKGLARLQDLFGSELLPLFVPPWNRVDPTIVGGLEAQGYLALSTYTPRPARLVAGLVQINTHVDPIHWKAGGGLVPPEQTLATLVKTLQDRRMGETDATEPLGFLTHHLVHDPAIWRFTEDCLRTLLDGGATSVNLWTQKDDLP